MCLLNGTMVLIQGHIPYIFASLTFRKQVPESFSGSRNMVLVVENLSVVFVVAGCREDNS